MRNQMTGHWRKSSYSANTSSCVEVAYGDEVGVRDTKNRAAGQLTVGVSGWTALVAAVRSGPLG